MSDFEERWLDKFQEVDRGEEIVLERIQTPYCPFGHLLRTNSVLKSVSSITPLVEVRGVHRTRSSDGSERQICDGRFLVWEIMSIGTCQCTAGATKY